MASLFILFSVPLPSSALAADAIEKPDPELLKRFEAERDAARAGQQQAKERIKRGEEMIREADRNMEDAHKEAVRELCAIGALPASDCP